MAAMVSWSVTAITVTPPRSARSTSSYGVQYPSDAVVWRWRSIIVPSRRRDVTSLNSPRRRAMRGRRTTGRCFPGSALPLHERAVLSHQQVEMVALLVREFEKDLLAFRVLEAFAVFLEEAV